MTLRRRTLVLSALAAPALVACSSGNADGTGGEGGRDTAAPSSGTFPVTVEHLYGATEISAEPQRIVTVSWVNADSLLALGVVPVGMPAVEWGGNENASTDWIDAKLDELGAGWGSDAAPATYSEADGLNVDEMAALTPDLIVAAYSGITQEEYEQLSKIAPTIGPLAANYTAGWQDVMTAVGAATGRVQDAERVIADVEGQLAAVGEDNPAVAGATFIAGTLSLSDNTISLYTAGDTRPRFFTALGMTQAEVIDENTTNEDEFFMTWSAERADELVSDIFYTWAAAGDTVESFQENDLFAQIPAVAAGGLVLTADDHLTLSISAANALSLPWAIENFVPSVIAAAEAARG